MTKIEIYTTPVCPYCVRAKNFLKAKGYAEYTEIDVSGGEFRRNEMVKRAGGRQTVPQIFINNIHIGGYDDMMEMERAGTLNSILHRSV